MKKLLFILCFVLTYSTYGQDSLRVMYYNLLNFPGTGSTRYEHYRTIMQYSNPDVLVVNELETAFGADLILDSALNVDGITHYQRANFVDGYDTDNGLFYNANKLGLVSQEQIGTVLRDVSVYQLYYKAPNLSANTDTVYCWFFSCHLKAGSGDFEQRNQEAQQAKYYLNAIAAQAENVFIGGDFNFYSGFESGCQTILNTGLPMVDPANAVGNWSGAWTYADWHSQSTRNSGIGGGSGGGMDDRFDLIFVSEDIMNNQNGVQYLNNSFTPLGQDGAHFNDAINSGVNFAVPSSIANALYFASDHLPVMMDVVLDETASVPMEKVDYLQAFYNRKEHGLTFTTSLASFDLLLYDLMGRVVFSVQVTDKSVALPQDIRGVYIWSANFPEGQVSEKIAIL